MHTAYVRERPFYDWCFIILSSYNDEINFIVRPEMKNESNKLSFISKTLNKIQLLLNQHWVTLLKRYLICNFKHVKECFISQTFIKYLNPFTLVLSPHRQAFRGIKINPKMLNNKAMVSTCYWYRLLLNDVIIYKDGLLESLDMFVKLFYA